VDVGDDGLDSGGPETAAVLAKFGLANSLGHELQGGVEDLLMHVSDDE
jgi:hypothetical protein